MKPYDEAAKSRENAAHYAAHATAICARRKEQRAAVARREGRPVGMVGRPPKARPKLAEMAVWDEVEAAALDLADEADAARVQAREDGR